MRSLTESFRNHCSRCRRARAANNLYHRQPGKEPASAIIRADDCSCRMHQVRNYSPPWICLMTYDGRTVHCRLNGLDYTSGSQIFGEAIWYNVPKTAD